MNEATLWDFSVSLSEFPVGPVVGAAVGVLLLLAVFGFFIWKRNSHGEIQLIFPLNFMMYVRMYSYNMIVLENIFIFIILNLLSIFQGSSLLTVRKQQIDLVFSFLGNHTVRTARGGCSNVHAGSASSPELFLYV